MIITWLGHSAFLLEGENCRVMIDPFISGNPSFPASMAGKLEGITHILLTHGHGDHMGDTLPLAKRTGAQVVTIYETAQYLIRKGLPEDQVIDMNIGGSVKTQDVVVHMVQALHSNSIMDGDDMLCGGFPTGFVVEMDGSCIYHAGDTGVFSDMKLIQTLYNPTVGLLPVGDRYTMSPKAAAYACNELLDLKTIIPMHHATFPLLTGHADTFKKLVTRGNVVVLGAGESLKI